MKLVPASRLWARRLTSLGNGAFRHCENLTSVSLPNSLVTIDKMAFGECKSLKELVIPDSVVSIGSRLIDQCDSLEKLHLPSGLTEICDDLISTAPKLKELNIPSGVTKIGDYSIYWCDSLTNIVLPEGLKTIGERAFEGAHNLKEINFPESLEVIGEKAFYSCGNLEYVSIPSNVRSIGKNAFSSGWPNSYGRVAHYVSEDNPYYSSDSHGVLFDKNKTVLIQAPLLLDGSYEIPDTVQTIEPEAFGFCINIDNIVIPNSVSSIGRYAFWNCKSLTGISIPGSVASIPEYTFSSCMLEEINLSEGLVEIGEGAFWGQVYQSESGMITPSGTLTIPSTVQKIGVDAFVGTWFESVIFEGDAPEVTKLYDYDYGAPPFQSNTTYYYHGDNGTWTEEAKIALSGEGLLRYWKPLGPVITVEIPETDVATNRMVCGTVLPTDNNIMTPNLVLNPEAVFTQVNVELSLPEGFSFAENQIKREIVRNYEEIYEVKIESLKIYPIYIDSSVQKEEYCITITVSAMDSSGEWMTRTEKEVFYRPSSIKNTTLSPCPNFAADDYTFTLDSATGSGTTYNQETARLCAMMSDMAYAKENMEVFLTDGLGFSDYERQGVGVDFTLEKDKLGRFYASKRIIRNGEIKNLVYVICRGTTKGIGIPLLGELLAREWWSNGTVGNEDVHKGFRIAAEDVKYELAEYCRTHEFAHENTIIVVTGHSRGAAVANLIGHWLNASAGLAEKENVSVYTFATPTVDKTVATEEAGYIGNENIFNFVNYQDFIRNAPSMKYYGRYGSTTIFAFQIASPGESLLNDGFDTYPLPNNDATFTVNEMLNGILYGADTSSPASVTKAVFSLLPFVTNRVINYDAGLKKIFTAHDVEKYYKAVTTNAPDTSFDIVNGRTEAAYQYVWQWWETLTEIKESVVKLISFHCPINLYVYDSTGNQVASIENQVISCTDENLLVYVNGESLNVAYYEDACEKYTFKIVGYDDGSMNHCIQTISINGIDSIELRKNIPIIKDSVLVLALDGYVKLENEINPEQFYKRYEDETEIEQILIGLYDTEHIHSWSDWVQRTSPTCDEKGMKARTCTCGEEETQELPENGHSYTDDKDALLPRNVRSVVLKLALLTQRTTTGLMQLAELIRPASVALLL